MEERRMGYPDEDILRTELATRIEEKKISRFAQALIRQGFAKTPGEAQMVTLFLSALFIAASVGLYVTTERDTQPVARDPYIRPLPARR
jgi:hypothetical protein